MSSIDLDDDLIIFNIDSLDDNEYHSNTMSDLSTSDCQSIDPTDFTSPMKLNNKKNVRYYRFT